MNERILHISLFLILAITENVIAQQGIGTNTPHRSAALDIESENKGILIPRVKLTALNIKDPIVSPIVGLTVYNTNDIDGLPSGFYFWKNNKWNRFYSTEDSIDTDTNTISVVERQENHDYVNVNVSISNNINTYKVGVSPATDSSLGVVKPGNGLSVNNGTLSVKNALPKFFYAPAIYIPTHNLNNGELLTDPLPINLYTEYTKQFTWQGGSATQFVSTDNIYGQARSSSNAILPIVESSDLDYFITYYDASVFYDVAVSNVGIMTYKVKNNAVVTPKTFINIVFKVKD